MRVCLPMRQGDIPILAPKKTIVVVSTYVGGRFGLHGLSTHVVMWGVLVVCTHVSSLRGGMVVGSRRCNSWIMSSTILSGDDALAL